MRRQPYLHNLAGLAQALEAQHMSGPEQPTVVIRRNRNLHRWVAYHTVGAQMEPLPVSDEAEAMIAVTYLKTKENGKARVKVELD